MNCLVVLVCVVSLASLVACCPPTYGKCTILPYDDEFNRDISQDPVDYMSDCYLRAIGEGFRLFQNFSRRAVHLDFGYDVNDGYGIPYSLANGQTPTVPVAFRPSSFCGFNGEPESDAGPYRIPSSATIEGWVGTTPPDDEYADQHLISLDTDNCILYETYLTKYTTGSNPAGGVQACSAAKFDLTKKLPSRTLFDTSADAAGLPIFPGLLKYEEAISAQGITHATRFTVQRAQEAFTVPASHLGPYENTTYLPYGARLRLKANFPETGYTGPALAVVKAWKKYGLIFADQGSNMFVTGTTNAGWEDTISQINSRNKIYHDDFEVVQIYNPITRQGWTPPTAMCNGRSTNTDPTWKPAAPASCVGTSSTAAAASSSTAGAASTTTTKSASSTTATTKTASSTTANAASSSTTKSASSSTAAAGSTSNSATSNSATTRAPASSTSASATTSPGSASSAASVSTSSQGTSVRPSSSSSSSSASGSSSVSSSATTTPKTSTATTTPKSSTSNPTVTSSSPSSSSSPTSSSASSFTPSTSGSLSSTTENVINTSDSAHTFPSFALALVAMIGFMAISF